MRVSYWSSVLTASTLGFVLLFPTSPKWAILPLLVMILSIWKLGNGRDI